MTKLMQKIKAIPKGYFSFVDLRKISDFGDASLKVAVSRLIKTGQIIKLTKGIYALDINKVDWENFSLDVYSPSYLSFEWALAKYNILSQKPMNLTLATAKRSKKIITSQNIIIYHHLQPKLFWGFVKEENYLLAEPEKAFLDLAYLSLNGYAKFDIEEMNLSFLDKDKLKKYLKKINCLKLNNLIIRFIPHFPGMNGKRDPAGRI